ncbi:MAG: TPR end-of-group domain-containing protein [Phycisphaerales bacterium JB040]
MGVAETFRPSLATTLFAAIVGLATFAGVLLYGPEPDQGESRRWTEREDREVPGWVQTQMRVLTAQGRDGQAIGELREELRSYPDSGWGWMYLAQLAARDATHADLHEEALDNLARLEREGMLRGSRTLRRAGNAASVNLDEVRFPYQSWFQLGWAARGAGDEGEARQRFLTGLEACDRQEAPGTVGYHYNGACFLALAGEVERAVSRLRGLGDVGYGNVAWLRADPDLDALHAHPGFEAIVERASEAFALAEEERRAEAERRLSRTISGPEPGQHEPEADGGGP